jgi:TonB-linked SusC/RagA family outer membrane protein
MKKNLMNISRRLLCYTFYLMLLFNVTHLLANKLSLDDTTAKLLSIQQAKISGVITDVKGMPMAGVTIQIKNSNKGSVSDFDGSYSITAIAGDILVFSALGYQSQSILVHKQLKINIQLQEDTTTLKEVQINAGYYKVKDKERTGSISKISASAIEKQPVTNALATMQGRMAGVNITQTTGTPGGGFEIQIRGQNNIRANGNNPLYIIDGVPYAADPIGTRDNAQVFPTLASPLNSINPSQIESIEVLKDADATAIYGSRGANGVVLITTKKGKIGKTRFTSRVSKGVGSVTRFFNLLSTEQYLTMRHEAFENDGIAIKPWDYDLTQWDQTKYTDWQEELLGGTANITDLQASVTGGSENTQYLLSSHYNKQTTVLPGDYAYEKGGVHLNVNHESENKKFKTNVSMGYTVQGNNQPQFDLFRETVLIPPNAPDLYDENGDLNWENNTFNNPLRNLEGSSESSTNDLIANIQLSYHLRDNLELKSSFGYTSLTNKIIAISPSTQYNPAWGLTPQQVSFQVPSRTDRKSWIIEPQLNWKKSIGNGTLSALVGATFQSQKDNQTAQYANGFTSDALIYDLASASNIITLSSNESEYNYQAFFARINYNLKEKYLVNLTGRRDGSSRFGTGKQFANFGAVGAAWIFSKENLFKDHSILSFGKLRASYGVTGSDQIGDYQYLDTYASTGNNYNGTIGLQPTRLFNPAYAWETNKKVEVALEAGFFNDRLFFTTAWYDNKSSNQLIGLPLPATTGFNTLQANLDATVQNKGFEFAVRSVNFKTKDFNWTTAINVTVAKNKLLKFLDLEGSTFANRLAIGAPLNIQKVYHFTGVDPQTGIYTFEDVNDDGLLSVDDKKTLIDFNPTYFGGLQNTLTYKNWQLDFLFQFVDQLNYNATNYFGRQGPQNNQPTTVLNHWQQPGDIAPYQIYTTGVNSAAVSAYSKYSQSDGAISDASYVRLKNISLAYKLPIKDVDFKLFFEGQNVLTFTKYQGADPEFTTLGFSPPLKIFTVGVQFSF